MTDTAIMWDPMRAWRQAWANITGQHGSSPYVANLVVCGDSIGEGWIASTAT